MVQFLRRGQWVRGECNFVIQEQKQVQKNLAAKIVMEA